jgi:hypothetical protein
MKQSMISTALFRLVPLAVFAAGRSPIRIAPLSCAKIAGTLIGTSAIVVFPILYGLIGFLGILIGAWLYNLLAAAVGGIQMDAE